MIKISRLFLTLNFLFGVFFANAQTCEGPPLLNENFSNGIPSNWTVLNLDTCTTFWTLVTKGFTGAFQSYSHNGEKCVANCAQFEYTGTADDYLITPSVTLGNGSSCLSWKASSQYTFYPEAYEVRISTTTPDVAGLMAHAPIYSTTAEPIRWNEHSLDLSAYAGQTIYIGFHYISSNQWTFFLDDIRISQPTTNDLRMTELDFNDAVFPGSYSLSGKILNGGTNVVSNCTINWQLDNGPVQIMPENFSLFPSYYFNFTHNNQVSLPTNGTHTLKVWTDLPNNLPDNYRNNDTITRTVFVHTNPKELLLEEFTQASCPPCGQQNPTFDALYLSNFAANQANLVKYQCPWPGVDPMNAFNQADVSNRILYYGTGGIPFALLNGSVALNNCGGNDGYPECVFQTDIDSANQYPGIFNISIQHTFVSSTQGLATVTVTPLLPIPYTSLNLRVALVESDIVYGTPPGTNGETEFHQVMRQLLPDGDGTALTNLQANVPQTFTFFHNIDPSFVSSDLRIVAWVQDDNTSFIYQSNATDTSAVTGISSYSSNENGIMLYPNPSNGNTTLLVNSDNSGEIMIRILDISGKLIEEQKIQTASTTQQITLQTAELSSGIYFVEVSRNTNISRVKLIRE